MGTIRVPLQWQLVKIRPGEYDWSAIDRLVKAAQTKQIEVLFTIRTTFREETKKFKLTKGVLFRQSPFCSEYGAVGPFCGDISESLSRPKSIL